MQVTDLHGVYLDYSTAQADIARLPKQLAAEASEANRYYQRWQTQVAVLDPASCMATGGVRAGNPRIDLEMSPR